jgi:hypothetical protein
MQNSMRAPENEKNLVILITFMLESRATNECSYTLRRRTSLDVCTHVRKAAYGTPATTASSSLSGIRLAEPHNGDSP